MPLYPDAGPPTVFPFGPAFPALTTKVVCGCCATNPSSAIDRVSMPVESVKPQLLLTTSA